MVLGGQVWDSNLSLSADWGLGVGEGLGMWAENRVGKQGSAGGMAQLRQGLNHGWHRGNLRPARSAGFIKQPVHNAKEEIPSGGNSASLMSVNQAQFWVTADGSKVC